MFQTPAASVVSSTSRRSTRGAARSASGGSSKIDTSHRQSRKRKKKTSILRPLLTKAGPVRKWAQVYRAPAENVGFKTLKWVPLEELTFEEKLAWNEDQQKPRGKVLTDSQEEKQPGEKIDDSGNSSDDEDDVGSSNRSYDASAS